MFNSIKLIIRKIIGKYYSSNYSNRINKDLPIVGRYGSFRFISDYSLDSFKSIKNYNDKTNIASIKRKKIIRFGFVVYTSSMWNVDELYHLLKKDTRFETSIILAHIKSKDKNALETEYNSTLSYFQNMHYSISEANTITNINQFDILFYLTPSPLLEKNIDLNNLPISVIVLHTSYSYMLAGNAKKLGVGMYHWSLKYYTDSLYYKELLEKTPQYTHNAEYFGFPKMDQFFSSNEPRLSNKKVIIYAPHHSVNYSDFKSATFEDNYQAIFDIAKKYSESTYWIYKPHPLLRANSVLAGIFNSVEEYDAYEKKWNELENGTVMNNGNYFSIFKGSDAMITDSISFLAEYQFTHNPLLLLKSGKEKYNDFGEQVVKILYTCAGNNTEDIEKFVNNIIAEKDEMFSIRKEFFESKLAYMKNGKTANKKIFEDIKSLISSDITNQIEL